MSFHITLVPCRALFNSDCHVIVSNSLRRGYRIDRRARTLDNLFGDEMCGMFYESFGLGNGPFSERDCIPFNFLL